MALTPIQSYHDGIFVNAFATMVVPDKDQGCLALAVLRATGRISIELGFAPSEMKLPT